MNEVQIFNSDQFGSVRTINENGNVFFCGTDVAKALGYALPDKAIRDHARCHLKRTVPHPQSPTKTIEMSFIPESDLYRLIVKSNLPAAEVFERWVFEEVLPAVRQTGAYMTPDTIEKVLLNPDTVILLATQIKDLQQQNARLLPRATYCDTVLDSEGLVSTTKIAKDFGKSAAWLNKELASMGIQFNRAGQWYLYQKYADLGYAASKTIVIKRKDGTDESKMHTYWTQKGRAFIIGQLAARCIYPITQNCEALI